MTNLWGRAALKPSKNILVNSPLDASKNIVNEKGQKSPKNIEEWSKAFFLTTSTWAISPQPPNKAEALQWRESIDSMEPFWRNSSPDRFRLWRKRCMLWTSDLYYIVSHYSMNDERDPQEGYIIIPKKNKPIDQEESTRKGKKKNKKKQDYEEKEPP